MFFHNVLLIVAYSLVAAPIMAVDGYVQGRLMIRWRQWLTERFLDRSLRDRIFYRISSDPSIDNPDQRISEDLNAFPGFAVSFVLQVLWGIVTGVSFVVVLWLISPSLVAVLAVCVGLGSLLTVVIGRPLIGINFTQRRREADFRHSLVRLRDNAEAIALYGGERREEVELLRRLYAVVKNTILMVRWQRNVAFLTYAYDLLLALGARRRPRTALLRRQGRVRSDHPGERRLPDVAHRALDHRRSVQLAQQLRRGRGPPGQLPGSGRQAAGSRGRRGSGGGRARRRSRPSRAHASPSKRSRFTRPTPARRWFATSPSSSARTSGC